MLAPCGIELSNTSNKAAGEHQHVFGQIFPKMAGVDMDNLKPCKIALVLTSSFV